MFLTFEVLYWLVLARSKNKIKNNMKLKKSIKLRLFHIVSAYWKCSKSIKIEDFLYSTPLLKMPKIHQNRRFFIGYPLTENVENRSKSKIFHRVPPYWKCRKSMKIKSFIQSSPLLHMYLLTEYFPKKCFWWQSEPCYWGGGK